MFNPDRWQTKSDNSGPQSALVQPGAERKPPQRVRFSEYNEIAVIGMPFERKFATFPDRNNAREIPRTVNQLFRRIENVADTTGRIEFDQSISPEAKGKVSAIGGVLKSAIGVARGKVSRLANTVFSVMKMTSSSRLDQDATSIDAEFRRDLQSMTGELNSKYLESRSSLRETLSEDVFQRFSSRDDDDLQTQIQSILQMNVAN